MGVCLGVVSVDLLASLACSCYRQLPYLRFYIMTPVLGFYSFFHIAFTYLAQSAYDAY